MSLHNVKSYKLAKVFSTDLAVIIEETETAIKKYSQYSRYKPVMRILSVLKDELEILKAHKKNCQQIIDSKGQIKEET